jgi:hypothetical protein
MALRNESKEAGEGDEYLIGDLKGIDRTIVSVEFPTKFYEHTFRESIGELEPATVFLRTFYDAESEANGVSYEQSKLNIRGAISESNMAQRIFEHVSDPYKTKKIENDDYLGNIDAVYEFALNDSTQEGFTRLLGNLEKITEEVSE